MNSVSGEFWGSGLEFWVEDLFELEGVGFKVGFAFGGCFCLFFYHSEYGLRLRSAEFEMRNWWSSEVQ